MSSLAQHPGHMILFLYFIYVFSNPPSCLSHHLGHIVLSVIHVMHIIFILHKSLSKLNDIMLLLHTGLFCHPIYHTKVCPFSSYAPFTWAIHIKAIYHIPYFLSCSHNFLLLTQLSIRPYANHCSSVYQGCTAHVINTKKQH